MIVACNAEGFDVPGTGFSFTTNGRDEIDELVASFPGCGDKTPPPMPAELLSMQPLSDDAVSRVLTWVQHNGTGTMTVGSSSTMVATAEVSTAADVEIIPDDDFDIEIERRRRALALADD
jgi:hypothetical protein